MELLLVGIAALLVYALSGKDDKEEKPDPTGLEPDPTLPGDDAQVTLPVEPGDDRPEPPEREGGGGVDVGKIVDIGKKKIGDWLGGEPDDPIIVAPEPEDDPDPGETPWNPLPSTELYDGFYGYFLVSSGDTLTKIAGRLGLSSSQWRLVRDDSKNKWAVDQCPKSVRDKYYGGEKGISLVKNYGKTPGPEGDCFAPGYEAKLYKGMPLTGQWCVLHYGG